MIEKAQKGDAAALAELAVQMWKENTIQKLTDEFTDIISRDDAQIFIKYVQDTPVGFAQCQLRYDYVEGTETTPVGYLEGIFIKEEFRHSQRYPFCAFGGAGGIFFIKTESFLCYSKSSIEGTSSVKVSSPSSLIVVFPAFPY